MNNIKAYIFFPIPENVQTTYLNYSIPGYAMIQCSKQFQVELNMIYMWSKTH